MSPIVKATKCRETYRGESLIPIFNNSMDSTKSQAKLIKISLI